MDKAMEAVIIADLSAPCCDNCLDKDYQIANLTAEVERLKREVEGWKPKGDADE
jgi:hypothetical protein